MTHTPNADDHTWPTLAAPTIPAHPTSRVLHDVTLSDDYAWLRADGWRDVLRDPACLPAPIRAVLEAENTYAEAHLGPLEPLTANLVAEMRGRVKEDDASVPLSDGGWLYYQRHRQGGQQPLFCRRGAASTDEHIMLDGDAERGALAFFKIGDAEVAPDHGKLAWSADAAGSELHVIRVRDLATGVDLEDRVVDTDGSIVWMSDSLGFYYVRIDENHRTCQVYRHRLGHADDDLVFVEDDPAWFVGIERTISGAFAVVSVSDHAASESHLIDLADPQAQARCVEPRAPDLRYSLVHRGEDLFIRTNAGGAEDYKIVRAPLAAPSKANWVDLVPHARGRMITGMTVYPDHLVRLEREDGLPRIVIRALADGDEHSVSFPEEAYSLSLDGRLDFESRILRFTYASMTTPRETFDYDLVSRERVLRKRQTIPSCHDPKHYVTRRLFAETVDGARVPITLLHRAGQPLDGSAPLLLYGYGAYGHPLAASFGANALSLVDRGFVYAFAHTRGGTDKGWHWYLDGKLANKTNTFDDFIAVARTLIAENYTSAGRIVAQGGSAGGMLMGAIANKAPALFAGIIAAVPFVDVLNTMLDAELPLTPPEWLEWGNPILDPVAFETIRGYSPYDNVAAQAYPPILALAGLTDPRVTYWEPAKWVARLRAKMTGGGPILLKTQMGAGHGGASGRFDRLTEIAEQFAFAIACVSPR